MATATPQQDQKCRVCTNEGSIIIECRGARRRRECTRCHHRWTTYEISAARLEQLEKLEEHAAAMAGVLNGPD